MVFYIGVHNSIPKYATTASISIIMTMPFHVMTFEKKFLKKEFSPQIPSKPPSPQEMEQKEKSIEKEKKERKRKRRRKTKAPRVSSNKGEVNILRGEKHFNLKNPF
jgi:hypothetical protein